MPTYDYRCEKCGDFEHVQKITEPRLEECPRCGGPVEKRISRNVGIVFKGSGFYITDSRSSSQKQGADAAGGSTGGDSASGGSTD